MEFKGYIFKLHKGVWIVFRAYQWFLVEIITQGDRKGTMLVEFF